ncbi:MAG TPA: 3'-5' exonuclease [Candidatus Limnocylindria bacterium]|nr:3'-5' exonuclease [Candidatus Limnocylindria bacterium]
MSREVLISVDIEASGDSPSNGSLVSIGACLVDDPSVGIYLELKPVADLPWSAEAEGVHKLTREHLEQHGHDPAGAMRRFDDWVRERADGGWPVFVGFNAPFDWMFVADAFWRYLGRNPFGISALDLKSLYMGSHGVTTWEQTRKVHIARELGVRFEQTHNALDDARDQASLARVLLLQRRGK